MRTAESLVDVESLHLLAGLRGQRWRFLGSAHMPPQLHAAFDAFFATETGAVTVVSDIDYLDFDGEEDSYACLSVQAGAHDLEQATKTGRLYSFHEGETIEDVLIVRDTISERRDGEPVWTYCADNAVVFVLSEGAVAVSKLGYHDEMLQVVHAESLDALNLPPISGCWKDKLGIEHTVHREVIAVADLLPRPSDVQG